MNTAQPATMVRATGVAFQLLLPPCRRRWAIMAARATPGRSLGVIEAQQSMYVKALDHDAS